MNSRIRIVKRGAVAEPNNIPVSNRAKTEHDREHETASMVQEWIVEWQKRKRSLQISAYALVRG